MRPGVHQERTASCPIKRWAARTPDAPALVFGDRRWTYRALDAEVRGWAQALGAAGVRAGDRVAVVSHNRPELVALFHAAARIRAVLAPLNARLTPAELQPQIDRLRPACVLDTTSLDRMGRHLAAGPTPATAEVAHAHDREDVRVLLFTSGTTGAPKAAMLTYGNFEAVTRATAKNLGGGADQVWLACLPLFHVGGLAMVHRCAEYGAALVLQKRFDTSQVAKALRDRGVTHLSLVATGLGWLIDAVDAPPPTLRAALVGGGPVPPALMAKARARGWPVLQTYGLTEACSQVATERPGEADGTTAGPPLDGIEVRIGEGGEILVRGPSVMRGYLDDAEGTAAVLQEGWLRTGDLGALDDRGRLTVFARRNDLIVSGGENVYPAEVEAALLAHPAIAEAAVVAQDDPTWGQVPVALVVNRGDGAAAPDALAAWCRSRLAGFKVPRRFIPVPVLPRTGSGKVDRGRLRGLLADGNRRLHGTDKGHEDRA